MPTADPTPAKRPNPAAPALKPTAPAPKLAAPQKATAATPAAPKSAQAPAAKPAPKLVPATAVAPPAKPAAKPPAPTPAAVGADLLKTLAARLSTLTGKLDGKKRDDEGNPIVIRPAAPVMIAEGDDGEPVMRLPGVFSTGCATLDSAIGRGGIPMARITTLTGGEGGGKTTIALQTIVECQRMGGIAFYIDNEQKLDLDYARALGVDLTRLLITQPGTIEDSLHLFNELVISVRAEDKTIPILGVLDSINASKSENEYEEDGTADMTSSNNAGLASQARVMSDKLPKIARLIANTPTAFLMISQPRDNVGYAGQNLVAGGKAPRYYSALIIHVKPSEDGKFQEESGKKVGSKVTATCVKNQVANPFQQAEFTIRWGAGVDTHDAMINQAKKMGLVTASSGGWHEMVDPFAPETLPLEKRTLKWQGAKKWHALTLARPDVPKWIQEKIRAQFR